MNSLVHTTLICFQHGLDETSIHVGLALALRHPEYALAIVNGLPAHMKILGEGVADGIVVEYPYSEEASSE